MTHGADLPLPSYQTDQASGVDLYAATGPQQPIVLAPGARALIPTGIALEMPNGVEAQIRPRSGLAAKFGLTVLNTPGTVDADYRGELMVIMINLGDRKIAVERGMRIAQLVFQKVLKVRFQTTDALSDTARGEAGFGSSGGLGNNRGAGS